MLCQTLAAYQENMEQSPRPASKITTVVQGKAEGWQVMGQECEELVSLGQRGLCTSPSPCPQELLACVPLALGQAATTVADDPKFTGAKEIGFLPRWSG